MEPKIAAVLAAIHDIMDPNLGSWQDKKKAILAAASEEDKTNLYEFGVWFTDEDDEEEEGADNVTNER
jgi:hypothetical protein